MARVADSRIGEQALEARPEATQVGTYRQQAEVLIPGRVSLDVVYEIVVASDAAQGQVEDILRDWPRESGLRPERRTEGRMFRKEAYYGHNLLPDPIPVSHSEET